MSEQKVAVVTGGSAGIGEATCRALAKDGWKVVVAARRLEKCQQIADEIGGVAMELDVVDRGSVEKLAQLERVDLLVNNGGIADPVNGPLAELTLADWRKTIDSHLTGAFLMCRSAIPLLRDGGSIVNMASTAALMGYGNIPAYAACKAGIAGMTRSLAIDFQDKGYGIRVNALAPGGIETPMVMGISGRGGQTPMDIPEGPLPADALGHPKDVAGCVLFLASDEARFLNGLTIPVDNGLWARPHH